MGRLGRDPETKVTQQGMTVTRFSIAVDRLKEGTDFFNVTTFGKTADFAEKYLKKGTKILLSGRIQNDSYTNKDGNKVTQTVIIGEDIEFCEKKQDPEPTKEQKEEWAKIDAQEELPFKF